MKKIRMIALLFPLAVFGLLTAFVPLSADAAFPVVEATNTSAGNDTCTNSHVVSLPASIQSGDLLIIVLTFSWTTSSVSTPTNWNPLFNQVGTESFLRLVGFYKVATGSEGATVTVTSGSGACSGGDRSVHQSYRISGYTGTPEATATAGSGGTPNPPTLSPSWGSAETLWIAAGQSGCDGADGACSITDFPSNYTNGIANSGNATGGIDETALGTARRELAASSDDPGTFTTSGTVDGWVAATIAIEPGSATAAPTVTTAAASGVTGFSATLNGNVTDDGGEGASVCGFAWGTNSGLSGGDTGTTTDSTCPASTGAFTRTVYSLVESTTYYFRAYATNSGGTGYGSIESFMTPVSRKIRLQGVVRFQGGAIYLQ